MTYDVRFSDKASSYFHRLDRRTQQRILDRVDQIARDPFGPHTKPLSNAQGRRAARVGDWRIVFMVEPDTQVISVTRIGPRGDVYRDL